MIIKEKSIKSYVGLHRVLNYIFSKHQDVNDTHFIYRRFLKGDRTFETRLEDLKKDSEGQAIVTGMRLENIHTQFESNDRLRKRKIKGETKFYHCVISFSELDDLSKSDLLKVAKHYTQKRFPKSIVVALNHSDTKHQHIHLVGSNVEYGLGTTRYLTKSEFSDIKKSMELWQDKELNLTYSRVDHTKKKPRFLVTQNIKLT